MAEIPQITDGQKVVEALYAAIKKKETQKFRLTRVGASGIGNECLRAIWYDWRGYDKTEFDGRMMRLFRTGHLQEDRIVNDLKLAGYQVWEIDEATGQQWTYNDSTGHFVAKLDGVIKGIPGAEKSAHTLEIKTHSKKSFEEVKKFGVERAKPYHFDQMMSGMLFSGIHRALYVALCKDNEEYYVERIVFDEKKAQELEKKIDTVIRATMPPAMVSTSDTYLSCRWCDHKPVCREGKAPIPTCRSCQHAEAKMGGLWVCSLLNEELDADQQLNRSACKAEHYTVI